MSSTCIYGYVGEYRDSSSNLRGHAARSELRELRDGALFVNNRNAVLHSVPPHYAGLPFVRGALHKNGTHRFTSTTSVRVFIAVLGRRGAPILPRGSRGKPGQPYGATPFGLPHGFVSSGEKMGCVDHGEYLIFYRDFPAGDCELRFNEPTAEGIACLVFFQRGGTLRTAPLSAVPDRRPAGWGGGVHTASLTALSNRLLTAEGASSRASSRAPSRGSGRPTLVVRPHTTPHVHVRTAS